jgi:hypothetical protein
VVFVSLKTLCRWKKWSEEEIKSRAEKLSTTAVSVWTYPVLPADVVEKYKKVIEPEEEADYNLEDYEYLQGEMMTLYELLKEKVMALDPENVKEEYKKLYIAFKQRRILSMLYLKNKAETGTQYEV